MPMAYAAVVVGTDGSESSYRAVERAAALAAGVGARLTVASAYHPMPGREQEAARAALGREDEFRVSGTSGAEGALAGALDRARRAGAAEAEGEIREGDPVEVLLALVRERGADLLVVGNRGINTLSGRFLGSVPADVSHRAPCDVLVVHTAGGGRR